MQYRLHRSGVFAALLLAAAVSGCANGEVFDTNEHWFSRPFDFSGRNGGYTFSELQETNSQRGSVGANDLVGASGACPGLAGPNPPPAPTAADGQNVAPASVEAPSLLGQAIALGMTECDVVRRAGAPANVQIGNGQNGGRNVVLTYNGGPRPGIYRFGAGRLMTMDRVEVAEPAPAPKKKIAKKKAKRPAKPQRVSTQ